MSEVVLDWYERVIEPEIRDVVRYLRNNGINTESSCGHEMSIQCQYLKGDSLYDIHFLLYNYFYEKDGKVPDYTIEATFIYRSGLQVSGVIIRLLKELRP